MTLLIQNDLASQLKKKKKMDLFDFCRNRFNKIKYVGEFGEL